MRAQREHDQQLRAERERVGELIDRLRSFNWSHDPMREYYEIRIRFVPHLMRGDSYEREIIADRIGHQVRAEIVSARFIQQAHTADSRRKPWSLNDDSELK